MKEKDESPIEVTREAKPIDAAEWMWLLQPDKQKKYRVRIYGIDQSYTIDHSQTKPPIVTEYSMGKKFFRYVTEDGTEHYHNLDTVESIVIIPVVDEEEEK